MGHRGLPRATNCGALASNRWSRHIEFDSERVGLLIHEYHVTLLARSRIAQPLQVRPAVCLPHPLPRGARVLALLGGSGHAALLLVVKLLALAEASATDQGDEIVATETPLDVRGSVDVAIPQIELSIVRMVDSDRVNLVAVPVTR